MILEALCRGNYSPPDLSTPSEPAYWEANHQVSQMLDCLKSQLSKPHYKLVEQLVDKIYSAQCFEVESYFKLGLASGMVLEREVQEALQQTMQSP